MNRLPKAALLANLVDKLREKGSWSGETHLQKAIFFLQELMKIPLGFEFILYKHGPFSFDLRDELTSLRADGILTLEPQAPPYGARFAVTPLGKEFQGRYSRLLQEQTGNVDFIAAFLGDRGVSDLERLATALYVTQEMSGETSVESRAQRLHNLKPHVAIELARAAVAELDRVLAEADTN